MGKGAFSFDDKEKHEGGEYAQKPGKPSAGRAAGDVSPGKGSFQDLSDKKMTGENMHAFGGEKDGELSEQPRELRKSISAESQQNPADSFEKTWKQPDFRTAVIRRALAIIREQVGRLEGEVEGGVWTMGEVRVWKEQLQRLEKFASEEVGGERKRLLREIEQLKARLKDAERRMDKRIRARAEEAAKAYAREVYGALDEQVKKTIEPLRKGIESLRREVYEVGERGKHSPAWQQALVGFIGGILLVLLIGGLWLAMAKKRGRLAWVTPTALVTSTPTTVQAFTPTVVVAVKPSPTFTPTALSAPPSPTPTFTPAPLLQWGIAQLVTALQNKNVPTQPCVSPQQAPAQGQTPLPLQGAQGCFAFKGDDLVGLPPAPDLTGVKELAFQLKPGTNELELVVSDLSGKENGKAPAPTLKKYATGVYVLNSSVPQDEYLCVKANMSFTGNQPSSEQPKINIQIDRSSSKEGRFDFPLPVDSSSIHCALLKKQYGTYMTWRNANAKVLQSYTWWLIPLQAEK